MLSSIKKKMCKCGCGKPPSMGYNGYRYSCAPEDVKAKVGSKNQVARKNKNKRQALSRKIHVAAKVVEDEDLQQWFFKRMFFESCTCENCGAINNNLAINPALWKSCQAHLLPKRHFKSLRTHELNGMVLGSGFSGLCFCHDTYDSNWEAASKMKIWPEVVRRFKIMYPIITATEHQYIPDILLTTLNR